MKMHFKGEEDFRLFLDETRQRLSAREVRHIARPDLRPSAVKILIMNKDNGPHVLLTVRSDKVRTHKGQISLPGGSYDETDGHILETAYRETWEETGIPREKIDYVGVFDEYISMFGFHISCFVGAIDYPVEYNFNADEISDYVEAPLSQFVNMEYERIETKIIEGKDYKVYYYNYRGYQIWGLTARILTEFAQKVLKA